MALRVPNSKYFRYRLHSRLRYGRRMKNFITDLGVIYSATATANTVTPVRTTNTKSEALIVVAGQLSAADFLEIDGQRYTAKTALTEVKAVGTLTGTGTVPANNDTVTIGSRTYTFQTSLTNVDGNVKIAGTAALTLTNLFFAINASGGVVGTDYATATTVHPDVVATNPTGTTVVATAKVSGVAANLIATTRVGAQVSWGAATLVGGIDPIANEVFIGATAALTRDNFVSAITAGAGGSTTYSRNTVVHPKVTAAASGADLLVTALLESHLQAGFRIPISKTAANLTLPGTFLDGPAWTATAHNFTEGEGPVFLTNSGGALPTGSPAVTVKMWVHVINANRIAIATSREALAEGNYLQTTSAGTGTHSVTRAVSAPGLFDALKRSRPRTLAVGTDIDNV